MRSIYPHAAGTTVRIGAKLRASREAQGLTLEQLASAADLTKGFISRVERDETMPSVPTLVQLCQALSLPLGALFEEPELQLVHLEAAPRMNMGGTGIDDRLVTPRGMDRVQMLRSSLAPNASGGDGLYTVNCEVESIHVIAGTIEVLLTDRRVMIHENDTLTLPGRTPHTWRAGPKGAEAVWVLVPAAWSGSA